ncbi:copper resistance CopC family protein [Pseudarthrobacter sp. J64]|uniref:copper resistance CopC family protein n=1 Tax=Pseudarthrobacter sp. J64 TaxID=3116485 RepID=UPI002E80C663|nr:copper resistance CopC family protein [Pseudarthrobacter sp. J64]MEE2570190.1 copper resistance CopC family protein [Pseudarthrobacter sp. J64]
MRSIRRAGVLPGALIASLFTAVLFTAVLFGASLFSAGPAFAHDAAEASSPTDGETVATAPAKVSVTFNNNPLALGAEMSVKDAAGTEWGVGSVQIVDNVASKSLRPGAPAGAYTVSWRVVSSDSHPIEGTFSFTATSGSGGSTTAAGSAAPSATGSASGAVAVPTMGTVPPGATSTPEPVATSSEPFPWSIVGFAAVALGLMVALGVTARRKLQPGEQDSASE